MSPATHERPRQFGTFKEFWPFYVEAHQNVLCRALHYVGAFAGVAIAALAVVSGRWWLLAVAPPIGYAFAWVGHFWAERNQPATFDYPLYSLVAEFKMVWLGLTGRMRHEVIRLIRGQRE